MPRLKKLKVDRIAILVGGVEPANKYPLTLLKSDKSNALQEMYKEIFEEDYVSKANLTMEEAKDCLRVLKLYYPDVPDDLENVLMQLSQLLIKNTGEEIMEKEDTAPTLEDKLDLVIEKLGISKEKDDFPSLSSILAVQEHMVAGNKESKKHVPISPKVLKRIRKDIADPPDSTEDNPVPSLGALFELNAAIVHPELFEKEAQEEEIEKEEDEERVEIAQKKSLGIDEDNTEIKKEEEEIDEWPSVFDASIYREE